LTETVTLAVAEAARLALARGGLLKKEWTNLPRGRSTSRRDAYDVIRRFGYLQLDTVSVAGARSHGIVLHSRLSGLDAEIPETLLRPGAPLFEYWGHEASWIPVELYPVFGFRRRQFRTHPWWGDLVGENPKVAASILERIRKDGPLHSSELEGRASSGWWTLSVAKKVVSALWSDGTLAVRERKRFQRTYDLAEHVIPEKWRRDEPSVTESLKALLRKALDGHGWATPRTLASTWRLRKTPELSRSLDELEEAGEVVRCDVVSPDGRRTRGLVRPLDLELAGRLRRLHPSTEDAVLLSPFDPLLWDRARVKLLFGFDQVLEIFKPKPARRYGYYCLPVLAGDRLVARCDVKAERARGILDALSIHLETGVPRSLAKRAAGRALERYASALGLRLPAGSAGRRSRG
jgi:uncharacterized protein YcaQ